MHAVFALNALPIPKIFIACRLYMYTQRCLALAGADPGIQRRRIVNKSGGGCSQFNVPKFYKTKEKSGYEGFG